MTFKHHQKFINAASMSLRHRSCNFACLLHSATQCTANTVLSGGVAHAAQSIPTVFSTHFFVVRSVCLSVMVVLPA